MYNGVIMTNDPYYEQYGHMCKAIVSPIRLKIIDTIGEEEMNVGSILESVTISKSNLSNHLTALFQAGVLNRVKKGSYIYYSLTDTKLLDALVMLKSAIGAIAAKKHQQMLDSAII